MKRKLLRTRLVCCLALVAGILGADQTQPATPTTPPAVITPVRTLTLRLHLNYIEPANLSVPAGRYMIRIINGIVPGAEMDYQLTKGAAQGGAPNGMQPGAPVASAKGRKGTPRARMLVNLTPGQYVLRAAGRQEWECRITVANPQ